MTCHIQTALRGDFLPSLRHEANNVRLQLECNVNNLGSVGHFKIEPCLDDLAELLDIKILNMAPVFSQMRRDAMSAGGFTLQSSSYGIRLTCCEPAIARFAHRGNVVDINAEFQHESFVCHSKQRLANERIVPDRESVTCSDADN